MTSTYSFGSWVRRRRRALDLTQDDLARQVGCAVSMIKKIEADARRPSRQLAARLAEYLAIPPAEHERFLQAARAELAVDRLDLDSQRIEPPQRRLDARPHNLPIPPTALIGREREIAAIGALLGRADVRLVTLTGPGGIGKTRLALAVATELLTSAAPPLLPQRQRGPGRESLFPDGLWLVELAPLADPSLVPQTVATTLELREEPGRPILATLTDFLRSRAALVIVDNCEHLVDASARLMEALLRECTNVHILATSREALGIAGETTVRVPPLSIPDARRSRSIDVLLHYDAVHLFVERAAAALPSFTITGDNATAIVEICRRLDGIPLALELAAARIRVLRVEQIAARLGDSFRLLTGGSRTALPRQQTLRSTMDWSHDLLAEVERVLLRRLAVFAGGWTLEAAEAVCAYDSLSSPEHPIEHPKSKIQNADVLDVLTQLVNKSLVVAEREPRAEARYRLLEPIRQYAREQLSAAGDGADVRDRHLAYYMDLAERAEPELTGPDQVAWLKCLEAEMDNMRMALEWARERNVEAGLRLASAIWPFNSKYGYRHESAERLVQLLAHLEAVGRTLVRAKALAAAARLLDWEDLPRARPFAEESLAIYRELGDRRGEACNLLTLGWVVGCMDANARAAASPRVSGSGARPCVAQRPAIQLRTSLNMSPSPPCPSAPSRTARRPRRAAD